MSSGYEFSISLTLLPTAAWCGRDGLSPVRYLWSPRLAHRLPSLNVPGLAIVCLDILIHAVIQQGLPGQIAIAHTYVNRAVQARGRIMHANGGVSAYISYFSPSNGLDSLRKE